VILTDPKILRAGLENKLGSVQALCAAPPVALVAIFSIAIDFLMCDTMWKTTCLLKSKR
jgi:hypothetical protein